MKRYKGELILIGATFIYGITYVFANFAGQHLPTFTINAFRYSLGFLTLLPFAIKKKEEHLKELFIGAFLLSFSLFIPCYIQQSLATVVPAGKIGFISSLYLIFVPIVSYLLYKKKLNKGELLSIIIAFIGLVLLCGVQDFSLALSDVLLLAVAIIFAFEILIVDYYARIVDPIKLMFVGFGFVAILNTICSISFETFTFEGVKLALPSLLFLGIFASALAYAGQGIGQSLVKPLIATIIMSLESVLSAFFGFIILHQVLSLKEMIGCILMFVAVLICELSQKEIAHE